MPIEELYDPTGPDHDCICEDADKRLFNPDCYWHGTEGVEIEDATPAKPAEPDLLPPATATELASRFDALFKPDNELVEDPEPRCEICGWSLAADRSQGCVPGDCSYRPSEGSDEWRRIKARREGLMAEPAEPEVITRTGRHPLADLYESEEFKKAWAEGWREEVSRLLKMRPELEGQFKVKPAEPIQHGVNCLKQYHIHGRGGYLHRVDDDTPYDVDGVMYCGRCHVALPAEGSKL